MTLEGHRRYLIHAAQREGFDAGQLEALDNQELVRRVLGRIKAGRLAALHDRIEAALVEKRRIETATFLTAEPAGFSARADSSTGSCCSGGSA
jgi:hypothetical protein